MPSDKPDTPRFRKATSPRLELFTSQPSERQNAGWYVWDMYSTDSPPRPVFVGEMEECQMIADALNAYHGN